jgi:hypothetical protein
MKRVDLAKSLGLKIKGQMTHAATPGRFGTGASALPDKREQRKLDQAAGLVPFAVKIHENLARRLRDLAGLEGVGLNELTTRILEAGLAAQPAAQSASGAAKDPEASQPAENPVAKKRAARTASAKESPAIKAPAQKAAARKAPAKKAPAKASQAAKAAR